LVAVGDSPSAVACRSRFTALYFLNDRLRYDWFRSERLMSHPSPEQLGPPSVRLSAFQLWVHSRQFPEAQDQWDGNWLNVTAHCGHSGASVWATGAILDSVALAQFRDQLERLYQTLSGEAVLESHEPNVKVRVAASDRAGHLNMRAEITSDHLAQGHWFEFEIDQSYLPETVAQLEAVLAQFPVRGING
jgi:hypothetical protein